MLLFYTYDTIIGEMVPPISTISRPSHHMTINSPFEDCRVHVFSSENCIIKCFVDVSILTVVSHETRRNNIRLLRDHYVVSY